MSIGAWVAIWVAIFVPIFLVVFLPYIRKMREDEKNPSSPQ